MKHADRDQVREPRPGERRLRVLLSAFAVSPARGSEPGVGWNIACRLGRYCDIVVLHAENDHRLPYAQEIDAHRRRHGDPPGVTFVSVPYPPLSRACALMHNAGIWATYYVGYRAWQRAAFREAQRIHAAAPFDVVHQLNMIGFREPGYLWRMRVPFVWGPIGGANSVPWRFVPSLGARGALFHSARNVVNEAQMRFGRRSRSAARAARHLWAATPADERLVRDIWGMNVEPLLETGTNAYALAKRRAYAGGRPLRLVWSGIHESRKALPLVLHAIAQVHADVPVELIVLGQGAETQRWKRLGASLGISDRVSWRGRLPHADALATVAGADAMVFTSLQEGTPHVVLEALALGLPVICHDAFGAGNAVTERCGIKLPMRSPRESVEATAAAVRRVAHEPGLVEVLSAGALERAAELSWDRKVERIAAVYAAVAQGGRRE